MIAIWMALALSAQDVDQLIRDLGSEDADAVRKARRSLVDAGLRVEGPLKAALPGASERHAEAIRFALRVLAVRGRLSENVTFAYLWIEEKIAEKPEVALPELLTKMLAERDRREFGASDFRAPIEMALEADPTAGEARISILRTIQTLRLHELAPRVVVYLKDPSDKVREFTAYLLVESRSADAGRRTLALLEESGLGLDAQVAALRVLTHLRHKEAAPLFARLVDDAHPALRARAIVGLGALRATEAADRIAPRLADDDPQVREAAAATLVDLKATDQVPRIAELLDPAHPPAVRQVALKTLVYLGDRRASGAIAALLSDRDKGLKLAAIVGLGRLADPETVPALLRALKDDADLRDAAAEALARIESSGFVPELIPLVRHKDPNVRRSVLALLRTRDVSPMLDLLKGPQAREAAALLGLDLFRDSGKRLARFYEQVPEENRAVALVALVELGEASARREASAAAAETGPLQHDILFALNGLSSGRVYRHLAAAGIKELSLKGSVESVIKQLAAILEVELVISDRCPKDALEVSIEVEGVLTAREAFARISRLSRLGFLFDGTLMRLVPLEEAIRFWRP
jgi:HEAT repeat protein